MINEAGVLGQVTHVYALTSEVTLLSDKDAAIPVLLDEVWRWTGGQPYMTQKLCDALHGLPARRRAGCCSKRSTPRSLHGWSSTA